MNSTRDLPAVSTRPAPGPKRPLDRDRLARAKRSFVTRRADLSDAVHLLDGEAVRPRAGDLVLARVERLGQHQRLQLPTGRRALLFPGDEILVCFADRYAPKQFEARVPERLGPCELVAGGGIAACVASKHAAVRPATSILPLGLLADERGRALNVRRYRLARRRLDEGARPASILVVGTSMDSGKSTTAGSLVRGAREAGLATGAAKLTGTGAGDDLWRLVDAGAEPVLDFTDAGFASTFRVAASRLVAAAESLVSHLARAGAEVVVLEIADGLLQAETAAMLRDPRFLSMIDTVVLAAEDAMGAVAGVERLRALGYRVAAVSGVVSSSPLASEEVSDAAEIVVLGRRQMAKPETLIEILAPLSPPRRSAYGE